MQGWRVRHVPLFIHLCQPKPISEAGMRNQLFSIKPDIQKTPKMQMIHHRRMCTEQERPEHLHLLYTGVKCLTGGDIFNGVSIYWNTSKGPIKKKLRNCGMGKTWKNPGHPVLKANFDEKVKRQASSPAQLSLQFLRGSWTLEDGIWFWTDHPPLPANILLSMFYSSGKAKIMSSLPRILLISKRIWI